MSRAEFAILGAGAIGSILAAHLARKGHSVTVLARGQRAQTIQNEGLRIKGLAEFSTGVEVLSEPTQLRSATVLIVAMKSPGTADALERLAHLEVDTVFSIQNGVGKNDLLGQYFGRHRVLGALANTSGELLQSGEVLFTRNVSLFLGELGGELTERVRQLAATIDVSGVRASPVADIVSREWSKFAAWLGLTGLSLATRAHTWQCLADQDSALVLVRLLREVALLAGAQAIAFSDTGALLPLRALLGEPESAATELIRALGTQFRASAPDHRMSSLQDLEAGRALEIEDTFGYAVRKARQLRLSLPLLETFYHLATTISRARV